MTARRNHTIENRLFGSYGYCGVRLGVDSFRCSESNGFLFVSFPFFAMAHERTSAAKRRFRIYYRCASYRFVDLYARDSQEARDRAANLPQDLFDPYDDENWDIEEIREVPENERFHPIEEQP